MYYAEKIIDGVLHWKGTPNGEWKAFTATQLTEMLMTQRLTDRKSPPADKSLFEQVFGRSINW